MKIHCGSSSRSIDWQALCCYLLVDWMKDIHRGRLITWTNTLDSTQYLMFLFFLFNHWPVLALLICIYISISVHMLLSTQFIEQYFRSFCCLPLMFCGRPTMNMKNKTKKKTNINYNFIDCCVRYGIWQDQFRMKFKRSCNQQEDERHSDQDTQIHRDTACRRTTFTEWSDWFVRIINRSIHKNSDVSVINEWQWHAHTHTHTLT